MGGSLAGNAVVIKGAAELFFDDGDGEKQGEHLQDGDDAAHGADGGDLLPQQQQHDNGGGHQHEDAPAHP